MNDTETNTFLNLVNQYEKIKEQLDAASDQLQSFLASRPLDEHIQDPFTGIVYKIVKPSGRFVHYKDRDYIRTAKPGERAGTLSKEKAKAAGFNV